MAEKTTGKLRVSDKGLMVDVGDLHLEGASAAPEREVQMTRAEVDAFDHLHGALRRHMTGGFSFEGLALALVREGWRNGSGER